MIASESPYLTRCAATSRTRSAPPHTERHFIATGTAIALGAIAAAGTQVAVAKMGANAAKDAARTQERAAERAAGVNERATQQALALQRDMYERGAAAQLPYVNLGTGALSRLGQGMGLPALDVPAPTGGAGIAAPATGPRLVGRGATPAAMTSRSLADLGRPMPRTAPGPVGAPTATGAVQLQAPDGTVAAVPVDQVAHYLARGARRVDGAAPANLSTYGGPGGAYASA